MGKRLIIKGANFTQNAIDDALITWFAQYADAYMTGNYTFLDGGFYMIASEITRLNLTNKQVNYIRVYCATSGSIEVGVCNLPSHSQGAYHSYNVQAGINTIRLAEPITMTSSTTFYLKGQGIITYWSTNADSNGWKIGNMGNGNEYNYREPCWVGYAE